jgi:acyl carrier protein
VLSQELFEARARAFLHEHVGDRADEVDGSTDLFEVGILDSLLLVAFLQFIEEQRGGPIDLDEFDPAALSTIDSAYVLVVG